MASLRGVAAGTAPRAAAASAFVPPPPAPVTTDSFDELQKSRTRPTR
jgi:hypothetical protein